MSDDGEGVGVGGPTGSDHRLTILIWYQHLGRAVDRGAFDKVGCGWRKIYSVNMSYILILDKVLWIRCYG